MPTSRKKRAKVAWIAVFGFAAIVLLALLLQPRPDLFSARTIDGFGEYDPPVIPSSFGSVGSVSPNSFPVTPAPLVNFMQQAPIDEFDLPHPLRSWPVDQQLPEFRIERRGNLVALTPENLSLDHDLATLDFFPNPMLGDIRADSDGIAHLPADARVQFVAFSIDHPKADDPLDPEGGGVHEPLRFRSTDDYLELQADKLDKLGVPQSFRSTQIVGRERPKLRLVFKSENLPVFRSLGEIVYDRYTDRPVGARHRISSEGDWHFADFTLDIWHDTYLHVGFDLLVGKMEETELLLEPNQQVVLGDRVRLGFLFAAPGDLTQIWNGDPFAVPGPNWDFELDQAVAERKPGSSLVFVRGEDEYSNSTRGYWPHCFLIQPDPPRRFGRGSQLSHFQLSREIIYLPDANLEAGDRVTLGILPHRLRVWFDVPKLEDMPNGRDVENLFDVRIPRVTFYPDPGEFADGPTLGDQIIHVVLSATEFDGNASGTVEFDEIGSFLNLTDTTPRELLQFYLDNSTHTEIIVDPEQRHLEIIQRSSSLDRLKTWWAANRPGWRSQ